MWLNDLFALIDLLSHLPTIVVNDGSIFKTVEPIRSASHISGHCVVFELCQSSLKVNVGPVSIKKATN